MEKRTRIDLWKSRDRGAALIILMILMVVIMAIGIWGLSSSRIGIMKAGGKRATAQLKNAAEGGLQLGLRRFQEIANNLTTDSIGARLGNTRTLKTTLDTALSGSYDGICMPDPEPASNVGCTSPPCPTVFSPTAVFDRRTENVICNFLGAALPDTQVIAVRKTDVIIDTANERHAIFLLNSLARDRTGRKQIAQAVVVVPYNPSAAAGDESLGVPYFATMSKETE